MFPDYASYLQLQADQEELDGELRECDFFHLPVYIGGIAVNSERVMLSVSTSTGEIRTYMGVSYELIRDIAESGFRPILSPDEAFDLYAEQVRVRLRWFKDLDEEPSVYQLLYEPTTDYFEVGFFVTTDLDHISAISRRLKFDGKWQQICSFLLENSKYRLNSYCQRD